MKAIDGFHIWQVWLCYVKLFAVEWQCAVDYSALVFFKKGNKYSIFLCMIFLRVTFIFYVYPVPLVLLLPNVGTHLPEATSPFLVVRQTVWCNIWSNANDDLIMFKPYRVHFVLFIKSFSFCFIFSAEPVRPIDPAAWISHTTALTAPYPHYGKGYLLLCSSIKGHFSVTEL